MAGNLKLSLMIKKLFLFKLVMFSLDFILQDFPGMIQVFVMNLNKLSL
jgi:hypothetical protein